MRIVLFSERMSCFLSVYLMILVDTIARGCRRDAYELSRSVIDLAIAEGEQMMMFSGKKILIRQYQIRSSIIAKRDKGYMQILMKIIFNATHGCVMVHMPIAIRFGIVRLVLVN